MKIIQFGDETIQPILPRGAHLLQAGALVDSFGAQGSEGGFLARHRVLNLCLLGLCMPAPVPPPWGPYKAGEEDAYAAQVLDALQDKAPLHVLVDAGGTIREDLTSFIYGDLEEEEKAEDFSEAEAGAEPAPESSEASSSAPATSETPSLSST